MSKSWASCSSATARRMATATSARAPFTRRLSSLTRTARSSPSISTLKAALPPRLQRRVARFGCSLQILRIEIATSENYQILNTTGNKELPASDEAEIAGTQERTFTGSEERSKCRLALLGSTKVGSCDTWAPEPNLADPALWQGSSSLRIGNQERLVETDLPTADQLSTARTRRCDPLFERRGVESLDPRPLTRHTAAHEERGLCQPVAGVEGPALETAAGERSGKALESRRLNRLGSVERHDPRGEVEPALDLVVHLAAAKVVGEVRTARSSGTEAGDGLQPTGRALEKGHGGHQDRPSPDKERLKNVPDQTHVVVERQPTNHD